MITELLILLGIKSVAKDVEKCVESFVEVLDAEIIDEECEEDDV